MGQFKVLDHPLIQHKLNYIRDKNTGTKEFREIVNEISTLMAYEVSRDMPLKDVTIETPIATTVKKQLSGKKVAIVPMAMPASFWRMDAARIPTRKRRKTK